jgi:hypothetical protein
MPTGLITVNQFESILLFISNNKVKQNADLKIAVRLQSKVSLSGKYYLFKDQSHQFLTLGKSRSQSLDDF